MSIAGWITDIAPARTANGSGFPWAAVIIGVVVVMIVVGLLLYFRRR